VIEQKRLVSPGDVFGLPIAAELIVQSHLGMCPSQIIKIWR